MELNEDLLSPADNASKEFLDRLKAFLDVLSTFLTIPHMGQGSITVIYDWDIQKRKKQILNVKISKISVVLRRNSRLLVEAL